MPEPITIRVRRFNPETDAESYWQDYTFEPPSEDSTLLDCINHIKWFIDGTLTYRMSCRSAICGSCAMRVNGGGQLVCNSQYRDHLDADNMITVEPAGNMPVVKDLVTDATGFWEKIRAVDPYIKSDADREAEGEHLMSPEDFSNIDEASTCIMCGACYSECTSYDIDKNFLGPAALAKAQRVVHDTRDAEQGERLAQLSEYGGMWDCAHCFACVQACPKPVNPLYRIVDLRNEAHKQGFHDNNGSRHARGFVDIVEESGWLDEAKLPIKSVGSLKEFVTDLLPMGIRMGVKNKFRPNPMHLLPGRHHPPVPKMNEITKIIAKTKAAADPADKE
ncbi:succinate dehydrogenase iron-sulfur subunit [Candidatus Poribacteria bacterium]|jgi:succinate dehydrogenase / fumarate reductase, iron-sulfur subunit|nr:succinate dehydrogenase iron-sulfur subunit [Candidatus Poribacteria bacterium]MBT5709639.1 succinate dehydrogenase iron-sulfur subunit [Candidatus Poribacteria bacterium]MBT7809045.1 succinate dehydrogenase iron-sulfur subunit [Candidatus Poribacteria bacterium]